MIPNPYPNPYARTVHAPAAQVARARSLAPTNLTDDPEPPIIDVVIIPLLIGECPRAVVQFIPRPRDPGGISLHAPVDAPLPVQTPVDAPLPVQTPVDAPLPVQTPVETTTPPKKPKKAKPAKKRKTNPQPAPQPSAP